MSRRRRRNAEIIRRDRSRLDAVEAHGRDGSAAGEEIVIDQAPARDDVATRAALQVVEQHDIGALSRRDHAAVRQSEGLRGGQRCGAVHRERVAAKPDQGADHVVEMALLGDVEGIAVVRAQGHERRTCAG